MEYFNNVIKKRSICFLLSDFLAGNYENALRIVARRHDIVGVHMIDPREVELPNVGLIRAVDAESGATHWVDTSMASVREEYAASFKKTTIILKPPF